MKTNINIIIVLSFLIFNSIIAQSIDSEINGRWLVYKAEMKDGSRIFPFNKIETSFSELFINNSKYCFNGSAIYKGRNNCIDFTLEDNFIRTSKYSGYEIERNDSDTLIICEKIDDFEADKLVRSYCVKEKSVFDREFEKQKNEKNIIATKFFTPKLNVSIEEKILNNKKRKISNYDLAGSLTIFPNKKTVTTEVVFSSLKSSKIEVIINEINNSFEYWDLTDFENFESIKIPFIFRSILNQDLNSEFYGVELRFFTNDISESDSLKGTGIDDKKKSDQLFKAGLSAIDKKNYTKAANFFAEAYLKNPTNLDALYNQAASYFAGNDKENACKTWKQLVDFGQMNGIELYKKNCN